MIMLRIFDVYTRKDLFWFNVAGFTSPMYVIWVVCKESFYEQGWNLSYDFFFDLADIIAEGSVGIK